MTETPVSKSEKIVTIHDYIATRMQSFRCFTEDTERPLKAMFDTFAPSSAPLLVEASLIALLSFSPSLPLPLFHLLHFFFLAALFSLLHRLLYPHSSFCRRSFQQQGQRDSRSQPDDHGQTRGRERRDLALEKDEIGHSQRTR